MSPITQTPGSGFPDWRRVVNWDSGTLFSSTKVGVITDASGILNVQPYAYIGGFDGVSTGPAYLQIEWFSDAAGATVVAVRSFLLSDQVGAGAQYRLPNLGPFVAFSWSRAGAVIFDHGCVLFGTNRFHPLEFIPQKPEVIPLTGIALGIGASQTVWTKDYYAGPVQLYAFAPAAGWGWSLGTLLGNGTTSGIAAGTFASGNSVTPIITPPGAWFITVTNSSGVAGTLSLAAQHSQTGST